MGGGKHWETSGSKDRTLGDTEVMSICLWTNLTEQVCLYEGVWVMMENLYLFCVLHRLVKRAMHGTRMLSWSEIRELYGREVVHLKNEGRWVFLNTLFSVSEGVMYMQVSEMRGLGFPIRF